LKTELDKTTESSEKDTNKFGFKRKEEDEPTRGQVGSSDNKTVQSKWSKPDEPVTAPKSQRLYGKSPKEVGQFTTRPVVRSRSSRHSFSGVEVDSEVSGSLHKPRISTNVNVQNKVHKFQQETNGNGTHSSYTPSKVDKTKTNQQIKAWVR